MMKRHAKIFVVSLFAVLSTMALSAVAAQAAGELRIAGVVIADEADLEGTGAQIEFLAPGLGLTTLCTSRLYKGKDGNLNNMSHGVWHALYHGCHVVGNKFCKIYPTHLDRLMKTNAGLILEVGLDLVTILSGGRYYLVISAAAFTTIYYTEEEGCTLPSETEVGGSYALRMDAPNTEATSHQLLDINATEEGELGVSLAYGEEPLTMDGGNASASLVGAKYAGKNYSWN
jgi:hypothetical protein